MAKIEVSLPSWVLRFIDENAEGDRSAFLKRLVVEEIDRRHEQAYIEQPFTDEEYCEALAIEALSLDPWYDDGEPGQ
jgi:hypothetical protein